MPQILTSPKSSVLQPPTPPTPPQYSPKLPLFQSGESVKIRGAPDQGCFVVVGVETIGDSTCYQICRPSDRYITSRFGNELEVAPPVSDEYGSFIKQILAIALKSPTKLMGGENPDQGRASSCLSFHLSDIYCTCCNCGAFTFGSGRS